jgi:hypothetical protein
VAAQLVISRAVLSPIPLVSHSISQLISVKEVYGLSVQIRFVLEILIELCRAIQNKARGMLTSGVAFFKDNVRTRTSSRTGALLEHFDWELYDYTPYISISHRDTAISLPTGTSQ